MLYGNVELHNVAELIRPDDGPGYMLTRIPEGLRLRLPASDQHSARCGAGAEVRCNLAEGALKVVLGNEGVFLGLGIIEVYQGPFHMTWRYVNLKPQTTEIIVEPPANLDVLRELAKEADSPFDPGLTRVLLPHTPMIRLLDIQAPASTSPPRKDQAPARRCLAYGTSITHGNGTVQPTGGYAMRAARLLGVDLLNLGFGNGGCVQPEMADYIASRTDWDFAVLELGTNCVGNMTVAVFELRVQYLLNTLTKAHPDKPLFCLDIFRQGGDGQDPYADTSGLRAAYRRVVRDTVHRMNHPSIVHIPSDAIAWDPLGMSGDLVHPSDFGMAQIAQSLAEYIRSRL